VPFLACSNIKGKIKDLIHGFVEIRRGSPMVSLVLRVPFDDLWQIGSQVKVRGLFNPWLALNQGAGGFLIWIIFFHDEFTTERTLIIE
jgi:hypothetical protein